MTIETLATKLLSGILMRGSIDRTLALYGDWVSDRRAVDTWRKKKIDVQTDALEQCESE